jgi:uncharacterized RDD family membrane protein YckC
MTWEDGQLVRSLEQVEIVLPIAGPTSRILAYAVDFIVVTIAQIAIWVGLFLGMPAAFHVVFGSPQRFFTDGRFTPEASEAFGIVLAAVFLLQFGLELGYFVFFERVMAGQSPGKRWLGLRVVQDGGFPITMRQSIVRNVLRFVDSLPGTYVVGLATVLLSSNGKRLGDLAAGTIVARLDRPAQPAPVPTVATDERGTFVFARTQIARIGAAEVTLALETLRRLDALDAERKTEALRRAADALATRLGHPAVGAHERAAFLHAVLDAAGVDRS